MNLSKSFGFGLQQEDLAAKYHVLEKRHPLQCIFGTAMEDLLSAM